MRTAFGPFLLVVAFLPFLGAEERSERTTKPKPGERPSDSAQLKQMRQARQRLSEALAKKDARSIATAEAEFRKALGAFAGVPEEAEETPSKDREASRPTKSDFEKLTRSMDSLGSGSTPAKKNRMELRHSAYLAIGLLALVEAKHPDAQAYRKQAAIELDYLIDRQAKEGFFPYPADPVAPAHLRKVAALAAKKFPDKVKDGLIFLDEDGTQFDTGCCSFALAYGSQVLKEKRFLDAARKAGDWALTKPLTPNWNYNSFSVWQLAKLYEVTAEKKYLDGAVSLARLGVLPGQMENGRWSDQHNARRVYHWIMVRGLVALLRAMPAKHADHKEIEAKTKRAIDCRVEETLSEGGRNEVHGLIALTEAVGHFGPNEKWEKALARTGGINPYSAGIHARAQARSKGK